MKKAAVVIGVNKTGKLEPLTSAADGAKRVAHWLEGEGFDVRCLTDETTAVTRASVEQAIMAFVKLPPRYHLLLVYFSGHGYWQPRSDVWLLSGAPGQPREAINLNTAADEALYCGIANVVFVSDACRSIANTFGGARIDAGGIFPFFEDIPTTSKVDEFKATVEARPAYEGTIDGTSQSVLTAALMAAYEQPEDDMVRQVVEGRQTIEVVPNRRLEPYLQRKVDALLERIGRNLSQRVFVNVPSSEDVYIARVRHRASPQGASIVPSPSGLGPRRPPDAGQIAAIALRGALSVRAFGPGVRDELAALQDTATEDKLRTRLPDRQHDHFESGTGFIVRGAQVLRAVASQGRPGLQAEVLSAGDGKAAPAVVRVQASGTVTVPDGHVASIAVQFDDRRCVVLAGLPGYIGHVSVKASGVSHVSYVPSANHRRWRGYEVRQGEVDRLRAMVALAVDRQTFHLGSEREAEALASRLGIGIGKDMGRDVDPTLGLYAAHAFSQAGQDRHVRNVLLALRDDLQADLFDVRLLASRQLGGLSRDVPVAPFCPMLTQTWSLLGARRVELHAPLQDLRAALCDSLWTTFDAEAGDAVINSVINGDLS